jgi:tetratricopeptide (TPR) repeat protein
LELLGGTPAPDIEVDSLNGSGAAYMLLKKRAEAEKALRRAVELSKQTGYTPGQAQALLTLSDEQNFFEDHPLAAQTAQEAMKLWQSLGDKVGIARTYVKLGDYYMAQNLLPESAENYESALGLWRELNNATEQAGVLIMLGFIEARRGEWSSTIALQAQARAMLDEKAEPYMMGQIATTTAEAFNENGMPEVGLKHYQQALEYFNLTKDPDAVSYVMWGLGVTYYLLHDYPPDNFRTGRQPERVGAGARVDGSCLRATRTDRARASGLPDGAGDVRQTLRPHQSSRRLFRAREVGVKERELGRGRNLSA